MDPKVEKMLAQMLSEIAKALKNGDESRIRELHARLGGRRPPKPSSAKQIQSPGLPLEFDLAGKFSRFESREALEDHLLETYPSKADIAIVARALKTPVTKADSYDSLMNKIVDATVGYRLRAETIRGKPDRRDAPSTDS